MFTKYFYKFFPPPLFLQMPSVGIDIADEAVRFIEFKKGDDGLTLGRYGSRNLINGIVEAGYINDPLALTEALKELKKKHGLTLVKASLPEEKAYLFKTIVPTSDEDEIRANIESKLEENVPLSAFDAIYDYRITAHSEKGIEVAVVVLPQKVVNTYLSVFKDAGLTVVSFKSEAQAIAEAVVPKNDNGTHLIVNFNGRRVGFFMVNKHIVEFSSTIAIGMDDVPGARLNVLSTLKNEVAKIFAYWKSHGGENAKIDSIYICGKNALLPGLDETLALDRRTKVELANVWVNAFPFEKVIPSIEFIDSFTYAVPVGLIID